MTLFLFWVSFFQSVAGATPALTPPERPYDVGHYQFEIEIDPRKDLTDLPAKVLITLKTVKETSEIELDATELSIQHLHLRRPSGKDLAFTIKDGKTLKIALPRQFKKGETIVLDIDYSMKVHTDHHGLFKVTDPEDPGSGNIYSTHFEPTSAPSFFPCNDLPSDKASSEFIVKTPAEFEVISNGKRANDRKFKKGTESWHEVHWIQDQPHSAYLVSLAVGQFQKVTDKSTGHEVSAYVGKTKVDRAKYQVGVTAKVLSFYENYLGVRYPWAKYASVGIPTFTWGGMENTSSTHLSEERGFPNDPHSEFEKKNVLWLSAHELAHQWFGDYVTMKWWDNVWLNESFASYISTLAVENILRNGEPEMDVVTGTWDKYFRLEDGPRSHALLAKDTAPEEAFDSINYIKGENVLRMLNFYVGDEKFRKGLKLYLTTHALGNADSMEFFKAMSQASGKNLDAFRDSWLLQRGYPVITYGGSWDKKLSQFTLRLTQRPNHAEDSKPFTFHLPVVLHRRSTPSYEKSVVVDFTDKTHSEAIAVLEEPEWITVNPGGIVLSVLKPEDANDTTTVSQALYDPDPITRVAASRLLMTPLLAGGSLSDLGERTLIKVLKTDPSPYVRTGVLAQLQEAQIRFLPEDLGDAVYDLAKVALESTNSKSSLFLSDPHGWSEWRSNLLATLGKVDKTDVLALLAKALSKPTTPLDDVGSASKGLAMTGSTKAADILKTALQVHGERGYRYRYLILIAFASYENSGAVAEIREMAKNQSNDVMARIGWEVKDNLTLRNSKEWADFVQEFVLTNSRFGDEIKSRMLSSIEDVKTAKVKAVLSAIADKSPSERLKDASKKILTKNFA